MKHLTLILTTLAFSFSLQGQIIRQDIIIDSLSRDSVVTTSVARLTADTIKLTFTIPELEARIRLFKAQEKLSNESILSGMKRLDSIPDPIEKRLFYEGLVRQDRELSVVKTELFTLEQIRKKLTELKIIKI